MKGSRRFWLSGTVSLLIVLLAPFVTLGQRGGVRMSRPIMVRSRPAVSTRSQAYSGVYRYGSGEGIFPGIGLGLGYGFYGTNQNFGIRAVIDPATQLRLAVAQRFLRNNRGALGYGEYYLLDGGEAYPIPPDEPATESAPQEPPVVVLQQPPPQTSAQEQQPAAPIPDEGEFTLVLRDGKNIQVVAFTHTKERIIYIGADGSRHTIAADELDSDATVRVNQERGTPLQLPL